MLMRASLFGGCHGHQAPPSFGKNEECRQAQSRDNDARRSTCCAPARYSGLTIIVNSIRTSVRIFCVRFCYFFKTPHNEQIVEKGEPNIIFEDANMLVVDKPAGLVVHSDGRTAEPTLSDWVVAKYPLIKDVGGLHTLDSERYAPRAGILHRLDRETSGVIIIAKNDETFYFLQRQFLDHSIQKTYHAFVHGVPKAREGDIDLPIGRSRSDFRRWTTGDDARGTQRAAETHYRVLKENGTYSLLELRPKTGRTHQLRVHLLALGCPILCDDRYGTPAALGFERLALHALSLSIKIPSGEQKTFTAPLPPDFLSAAEIL